MTERYLDGSIVPPHLCNLRFVPWPLKEPPKGRVRDVEDPTTWGTTGGFVSDERFSRGGRDRVIKRSNRNTTRKWYDLGRK